ncbi:MAG: hypothetical protein Q9226_008038, partial [Calogaya cf. arnoldii]
MAASTTQYDQDQPVLSHTFFKADLSIDVNDIEAGYENEIPLFKSLNPLLDAPGRIDSFWGRIAEAPETVLLANLWYTQKALSDFESSPGYAAYHTALSAGGVPPTTTYIDTGKQQIEAMLEGRVSITTVYFPTPVTAEQKTQFLNLRGLV